ncbi:hypothetical protein K440DRAFT_657063 [Wilcoxina mikolae CBS 423.85]|nr:hypothetical protein K440DRAFT_657063 [Wilcoxina mikolae CBS 423.85]
MSSCSDDYAGIPLRRRSTPSLPAMPKHYSLYRSDTARSRRTDHGTVWDADTFGEIGMLRPGTPQMDTRPLTFNSWSKQSAPMAKTTPAGRIRREIDIRSARSRCPPTPKRKSSAGATLKRSGTVDERKSSGYLLQLDGPADMPERRKSPVKERGGMAWLQRPEKREARVKSIDTRDALTHAVTMGDGKGMRDRSLTEPAKPTSIDGAASRFNSDMKRALSSGSRLKKTFALGADTAIDDESYEHDDAVDKVKKWKKRVFSKDFFKPDSKALKAEKSSHSVTRTPIFTPPAPSVKSDKTDKTVITKRSLNSRHSSDTNASQAASTVESFQMDGIGSPDEEGPTDKAFNDSVIGMIDGKIGGIFRAKCGKQWKPPILTLDMRVIAPVDRIPVKVGHGHEFWIAVVLQGRVVGDIDSPSSIGNAAGIGLDVGILLDISSFTSPESFEQMKTEAKRLVEAMETSKDRVAVMTFKSPPVGKRKPSPRGRPNIRVLNSTGSVAKKQLIEDISMLEPGLTTDPTGRDVPAAVYAAVKTLQKMPVDTGRYGSKRSGHLFLITSKLDNGVIHGDFKGVKVHILGVGPIFNPSSTAGGDGWCAAISSPLDPVSRLQRIVVGGIDIPVDKPSGATDVKTIINLLRMGVDVGVIEGGDLFLHPGEGCKLKGVLGDTAFPMLLPGERKSLMVKVEVGNLPGWDSDDMDIDNVERQLKATLGQLTSTVLTVETVYCHSHLSTPATTITTKAHVDVLRYVEGCVWSRSTQELNEDMPEFFTEEKLESDKTIVNSVLVQVLASRHASSRDARNAIEQLKDRVDAPAVLRELGYQVYLEDRFRNRTISESSTGEIFTEPMMEVFERRFSPEDNDMDETLRPVPDVAAKPTAREFDKEGSDLLMDGTGPNEYRRLNPGHSNSEASATTSQRIQPRPERQQSPDEAKKLWMRLGGYDEENDLGALSMSDDDFEDVDDRDVFYGAEKNSVGRSNSVGQDTMVTYRDVRETDFSPWAL